MNISSDSPQAPDGERIINRLVDASVITRNNTGDDLTLADDFRALWRRRMEHVRERDRIELLALLLDADPKGLTIEDRDSIAVAHSGRTIGEWPSEAALIADIAAFVALGEQLPAWEELDGTTRDELIARLRVFLECCPSCGGKLEDGAPGAIADETAAPELSCVECGAALF